VAYDDNMSGVLFKNDKKEPGSKQPDYTGNCTVNGVELQLGAWIKESGPNSRNPGRKFMSLSFSPPRDRSDQPKQQSAPPANSEANDFF
jgi:hypothetical protein